MSSTDPDSPNIKGFKLLTLENEKEVDPKWPLAYLRPGYTDSDPAGQGASGQDRDENVVDGAESGGQGPSTPLDQSKLFY
jgi:hypothetical protein